jgi:hypothetical protein
MVRNFGYPLLDAVHPVTGRIHADFMPAAAKSGRFAAVIQTSSSYR